MGRSKKIVGELNPHIPTKIVKILNKRLSTLFKGKR